MGEANFYVISQSTPPPPASPLKAAYFNIYHLGLILESRDFHLFVDSLSES